MKTVTVHEAYESHLYMDGNIVLGCDIHPGEREGIQHVDHVIDWVTHPADGEQFVYCCVCAEWYRKSSDALLTVTPAREHWSYEGVQP
jgi:hypothetical protein